MWKWLHLQDTLGRILRDDLFLEQFSHKRPKLVVLLAEQHNKITAKVSKLIVQVILRDHGCFDLVQTSFYTIYTSFQTIKTLINVG